MKHLLLKSWLVLVCLLMGVGTSWAKEVTVTLADGGSDSDSSAKIANSGANIDAQKYSVDVNNFVNSIVAGNAYVYQAKTGCGWKFGNSSNPGKITIKLKNAVEIASVTVTAKNASSKVADIKIGSGTAQALKSDFSNYTQNYTSGNSTSSIVIETDLHTNGDRRAYVTSIVITTVDVDDGDTPETLSVPSNLQSSNVTTTSATLSWDAVANASSYTVKIGETEHTGLNTNSYSATGLTAGTQYTWTVKAVGDGTNYTTSAYAANANFTTEAEQGGGNPQPATLPHTATFNGSTQTYTTGWTTTATGLSRSDCVVVGKDENLTSPAFDLSSYETVTVTFIGRKYGNVSNSKAVVDLSISGVSQGTIDFTATSVGPVSGNITFTPTQSMTNAVLVFTCTNASSAGSTHGAGFGSITITGKVPTTDPYFEDIETVKIAQDATSGEFAYVLGNPDGSTLVAAEKEDVDWISNVAVDEANKKVTFDVTPNTGAAREAIITLTYGTLSKDVTISQAKLVLDYTTLPFNVAAGTTGAALKDINGITCKIDGSDYNNQTHRIKLSANTHYIQVKTNEHIGVCSFSFKGCAGIGSSSFKLQESVDGTEWTDVESFTVTFDAKDEVKAWTSTKSFSADARYVKLAFQKTSGEVNCGLGEFSIAKYVPTNLEIEIKSFATDGELYYATFSSEYAWVVPEDLIVSEARLVEDKLAFEPYKTSDVVPANTGVLVSALAASTYVVNVETDEETLELAESVLGKDNMLHPASEDKEGLKENHKFYMLARDANGENIGFYYGAADGGVFTSREGSAYLAVPTSALAPARFIFGQRGVPTDLLNVNDNNQSTKVLRDGRLYIVREGKTYDSLGRLVK